MEKSGTEVAAADQSRHFSSADACGEVWYTRKVHDSPAYQFKSQTPIRDTFEDIGRFPYTRATAVPAVKGSSVTHASCLLVQAPDDLVYSRQLRILEHRMNKRHARVNNPSQSSTAVERIQEKATFTVQRYYTPVNSKMEYNTHASKTI